LTHASASGGAKATRKSVGPFSEFLAADVAGVAVETAGLKQASLAARRFQQAQLQWAFAGGICTEQLDPHSGNANLNF
jgi:hypothetical protein